MEESSVSGVKDSWVPITPVKSSLTQQQTNELESQRLPTRLSQETEVNRLVTSQVSSDKVNKCNEFPINSSNKWDNVSFGDLLALADAATAMTSENATQQGNIKATNNRFESSSANSSLASQHLPLGTNLCNSSNSAQAMPQYERKPDAVSSSTISPQFAPITPGQPTRVENRQVSRMQTRMQTAIGKRKLQYDNEQSQLMQNNHIPDDGNHGTDLDITPQQKQRKRKHRPKVVIEGQLKRTREPAGNMENQTGKRKYVRRSRLNNSTATPSTEVTSRTTNSETARCNKENPTGKRKYVRRNKLNNSTATPSTEVTNTTTNPETTTCPAKSCRRSLNFEFDSQMKHENNSPILPSSFNSESQAQNSYTRVQSKSTMQLGQEMVESSRVSIANKQGTTIQMMMNPDAQLAPRNPNCSNCSSSACFTKRQDVKDAHYNYLQPRLMFPANKYNSNKIPVMHSPEICKRRSEKVQSPTTSSTLSAVTAAESSLRQPTVCPLNDVCIYPSTSKTKSRISAAQFEKSAQNVQKTYNRKVAKERLMKKKTKGPTPPVHELASLSRVSEECKQLPTRKKRIERNSLVSSVPQVICDHHQSIAKSIAPSQDEIDAIVEQMKCLDINGESNQVANHEHNAIVLYQRDGTVVPFEGKFNPVKRRKPRVQVDLDEETNRVWNLLLENINSEGIDGTDEETAKHWEEERSVFRGRADSFIARMHLIQGDRRFSQWKGSVVDSVVGVFLTQNVSDHLSSSAFMSLAARFPLKSKSNHGSYPKERTSILVKEPEDVACNERKVVNSNESRESNTGDVSYTDNSTCTLLDFSGNGLETRHQSAVNRSTTQITEAVESSMGSQTEMDDVFSSQNSAVSSQDSPNSCIGQTADRIGQCSPSNSETDLTAWSQSNSFGGSISFTKLLQMAGTTTFHKVYGNVSGHLSSTKKDGHNQAGIIKRNSQKEKDRLDGPKVSSANTIASSNHLQHITPNSQVLGIKCFNMSEEESIISDISKKNEKNCKSEQKGLTAVFGSEATVQKTIAVSFQEAPISSSENNYPCGNLQGEVNKTFRYQSRKMGDPMSNSESQTQERNCNMQQVLEAPNFSGEALDITESTRIVDNPRSTEHKAVKSNFKNSGYLPDNTVNWTNTNSSKAKMRRMGKEKQNAVDWDSLRKQAQANGKQRERTASTMDSLDWDAVRCADVDEIANTIKERGMNNRLAERIQDFLNRLVKEHGSIDLEWLRDVPPDKAKEYLLSIRGLGLKSVECVRLLTLHHIAFPVDTNVGRIAVRLGWVPLRPLPESLQLHLLQLYPLLESVQKYLWPRLCKLDQRTLYELHYQMITFGKVFCTKDKPNCNACPMRGECRHFASAFASARLSLPGPEEKHIVSATENKAADQNPIGMINQMLHLPQADQRTEVQSKIHNCESVVEVPAMPEPIIELPTTPEAECSQISFSDIEEAFYEDPDEIPTIKLNIEEFTQNLQNYMQQNMELQEGDMSKALVALTPEAASIPTPKLKSVSRLRTEHQVYELPDSHPLLEGLDKREPDDPGSYLLAIWTPGETASSIQPPENRCTSQELGKLCDEKTCFSCNSIREANSQMVRGTLLIPCRTAMRGSFPLNGTYFQVNEVFADHESSLDPIQVPRAWIWNLPRRMVYFGTSIPTIFKGLTTEGIQYCFWRGLVCVRGFDRKTRAPRPLMARLHFPTSKLNKTKGKTDDTGSN